MFSGTATECHEAVVANMAPGGILVTDNATNHEAAKSSQRSSTNWSLSGGPKSNTGVACILIPP